MAIVLCKFEGCVREGLGHGLCGAHRQQENYGSALRPLRDKRTVPWRLDERTNKNGPNGCWLWEGSASKDGYGNMKVAGRVEQTHRLSYIHHKGKIPEGHIVDHTCHVLNCINPEHLRAATQKQNCENREGLATNNTSGYKGVSYVKRTGKYVATITHHKNRIYLGAFLTAELAWEARKVKELELFTHSPLHTSMVD